MSGAPIAPALTLDEVRDITEHYEQDEGHGPDADVFALAESHERLRHRASYLLASWVAKCCTVDAEFSGDIVNAYRRTIHNAQVLATQMGLPWDDALVPAHVREYVTGDGAA